MTPNHRPPFHPLRLAHLAIAGAIGLLAMTADAAQVTGTATITIDNTAFGAASVNAGSGYPNGWFVEKHWGPGDNLLGITATTTGGTSFAATGSTGPMTFPVNTNTTTQSYPAAGPYGRTEQATTMDAANTSVGQIGLSGAWRLASPGGSGILTPYDFRLMKTAGTWNLQTFDTGFQFQDFLQLTNVTETLNSQGQLTLNGNLVWTGLWATLVGANTNTVVGNLNLTPNSTGAVSVPAMPALGIWLLGFGLAGIGRTKLRRMPRVMG